MFWKLTRFLVLRLLPLALILSPTLFAQEGLPHTYPPEWIPPLEQPITLCQFSYMGYAQTSQGVLQDDPFDKDLLSVKKGWTDWGFTLLPEGTLGHQIPTLEAGVDLVVDRYTYLIGASPWDRLNTPARLQKVENIKQIEFVYQTGYQQMVAVQARASVYLNGTRIKQYLITQTPLQLQIGGACLPELGTQSKSLKFDFYQENHKPYFTFNQPGQYLVRTEFVYHDPDQLDISKLESTGIALDVIGRVVRTLTPTMQMVPIFPYGASQSQKDAFFADTNKIAGLVENHFFEYFPVAQAPATVGVSDMHYSDFLFEDFFSLVRFFLMARRHSDPDENYDRTVVLLEKDFYLDITALSNKEYAEDLHCFAGINFTKHLIFLKGMDISPHFNLPKSSTWKEVLHKIYHSLRYDAWVPIDGYIDQCSVSAYHGKKNSLKVANGIQMGFLAPSPFLRATEIMQEDPFFGGPGLKPGQCSWRFALEELSQAKVDPPVIMVSGTAQKQGIASHTAKLNPLYQMDGFVELDELGSGDWHILLKDDSGTVLADYPFQPDFFRQSPFGPGETLFNYTLADLPGLARVEITAPKLLIGGVQQEVLDAIDYSRYAPTIWRFQAQEQTNNVFDITWTSFDFDQDPLLYTLLASSDGKVFQPTEIFESSQTTAILEFSPSITHLKLVVTDGARSVQRVIRL